MASSTSRAPVGVLSVEKKRKNQREKGESGGARWGREEGLGFSGGEGAALCRGGGRRGRRWLTLAMRERSTPPA